MSKFDEILNSWDEADTYLNEKIERINSKPDNLIHAPYNGTSEAGTRGFIWHRDPNDGCTVYVSGEPLTTGNSYTYIQIYNVNADSYAINLKANTWYIIEADNGCDGHLFFDNVLVQSVGVVVDYNDGTVIDFESKSAIKSREIQGGVLHKSNPPRIAFKPLDNISFKEIVLRLENLSDAGGTYTLDNEKITVNLYEYNETTNEFVPYHLTRKGLYENIESIKSDIEAMAMLMEVE